MYNLLISGDVEAWERSSYLLDKRRFGEYTSDNFVKDFDRLDDKDKRFLFGLPCIFAYEAYRNKQPKFGSIVSVDRRDRELRINYRIIDLDKFISHNDIIRLVFALDIGNFEINRTHWALKDVNLQKELQGEGIVLPLWAQRTTPTVNIEQHKFDVAFSFPGEIREYVESIASELERLLGPNTYFYDNNYKAQLARPRLDILLQNIYMNRSKLIVVFLCQKYDEKEWCGVEFRAILEIIKQKHDNKIMFVKMDDGKVEGVFSTDGYVDGRKYAPDEIAYFIKERVVLL